MLDEKSLFLIISGPGVKDIHVAASANLARVRRAWRSALALVSFDGGAFNAVATEALATENNHVRIDIVNWHHFQSFRATYMVNSTPAYW